MKNKMMYKIELLSIKYTPIVVSLSILIGLLLTYNDIDITILDIFTSASIIATIPMYISSYVYKFCKYHRMFIHYIVVIHFIDTCDMIFNIPIDDYNLLITYLIITGIFIFIIAYLYLKYGDRNINEGTQ